jgi:hypothetical protein
MIVNRYVRQLFLAALLILTAVPASPVDAAAAFDSEYAGESAFLPVQAGQGGSFTVFFSNTGTETWVKGTSSQVVLAVCLQDKLTCNVESPLKAWNDGWASNRVYALQAQAELRPRQVATFSYRFKAPLDILDQTYEFHGDLMLSATGRMIHQEGYYQAATSNSRP